MVRVTGLCWVAMAGEVVMVGDGCGGGGWDNSDTVAMVGDGESDVKSVVMVAMMMVVVMDEETVGNGSHEATCTLQMMNVT